MTTKLKTCVTINSHRHSLFILGLIIALALCLAAFEYTTIEKILPAKFTPAETINDIDLITEVPEPPKPQNQHLQQPQRQVTVPSTAPTAQNIVTRYDDFMPDDNQQTVNNSDAQGIILLSGYDDIDMIDDEEPVDIVAEMPVCKECIKISDEEKRAMCTHSCLNKQILPQIKYPKIPLSEGISGTVYVHFVVEKDGTISHVQVLRGVHPELDAEAVRVIKNLKPFEPGKNLGKPQRVRLIQPVKFSIAKN